MIRLQVAGDKMVIDAQPHDRHILKAVTGTRYMKSRNVWEAPVSLVQFAAIRGMAGTNLSVADSATRAEKRLEMLADKQEQARKDHSLIELEPNLYPFQNAGVRFLGKGKQVLLADEMGTGKTVQALVAIRLLKAFPLLVVCTNSMKHKWAEEIEKWTNATPVVVGGTAAQRKKAIASTQDIVGDYAVIINYESLRLHSKMAPFGNTVLSEKEASLKELNYINWATVIADEVHRAKEPKAKQTRALWGVSADVKYRFGLTGTPIMNNPDDLWSIMRFVCPQEWSSRSRFRDRYCNVQAGWHGGLENRGLLSNRIEELDKFLQPRMIRRTKKEVLPQLPEKVHTVLRVPMTDKQSKAYRDMLNHMMAEVDGGFLISSDPLSSLGRLRYLASAFAEVEDGQVVALKAPSNKLIAIEGILEEGGTPIVVYAESRKLIEFLDSELSKSYKTGLITGKQSSQERNSNIELFQDGGLDIILATTGAGAEGITLTAANRLVMAQESWSNTANKQAHDRIHRIGQENKVEIITLIAKATIDETVHMVCGEKEIQLQRLVRDPEWFKRAMVGDV